MDTAKISFEKQDNFNLRFEFSINCQTPRRSWFSILK